MSLPGDFEARLRRRMFVQNARCFDEIWSLGPPCGECITCRAKAKMMADPAPKLPLGRKALHRPTAAPIPRPVTETGKAMSPRNVHFDEDLEALLADSKRREAERREANRSKSYVEWLERHSPQQYRAMRYRRLVGERVDWATCDGCRNRYPNAVVGAKHVLNFPKRECGMFRIPQPSPGEVES